MHIVKKKNLIWNQSSGLTKYILPSKHIFFVMECLLDSRVIFWFFFENLRKFLPKSLICRAPLTGEVAKRSTKIRNNTYHKVFGFVLIRPASKKEKLSETRKKLICKQVKLCIWKNQGVHWNQFEQH